MAQDDVRAVQARGTSHRGVSNRVDASQSSLGPTQVEVARIRGDRLDRYIEAAWRRLAQRVRPLSADTARELERVRLEIPERPRRLLALRGYLRAGARTLYHRWAFSRRVAGLFALSPAGRALDAATRRVKNEFARRYPGFRLGTSPFRPLERQIAFWNGNNRTVLPFGRTLETWLLTATQQQLPLPPTPQSVARFEGIVRNWVAPGGISSATPGLSRHGRGGAVDFVVIRNGVVVAGTSTALAARDWDAPGWTQGLREVVQRVAPELHGPLERPREPWHYDFRPRG
jgi:hypothetical protein